jgi:hypothetical protein
MITISTKDYTTEQLKHLAFGLCVAQDRIMKSKDCKYDSVCVTDCKAYVICTDLTNTCIYLIKKIKEREVLEAYRYYTRESERKIRYDNR